MSSNKMAHGLLTGLLFLFIFLLYFQPLETGDMWWHLATGRWIAQHRQIPLQDPFPPITGVVRPWIFTQWLGSLLLYGITCLVGMRGLIFFRAFVFCAIAGIFIIFARRRLPFPLLLWITFLLIQNLLFRVALRPCMLNPIFISFFLICLFSYQRHREPRLLVLMPLMGIFWSNINLGSFVYGNLLIGIFLIAAAVEGYQSQKQGRGSPDAVPWRSFKELALCLGAYMLSFFVNPYGLTGFLYPFRVFLDPEFINLYRFNAVITEMRPAFAGFNFFWQKWLLLLIITDIMALIFAYKDRTISKDPLPFTCVLLFLCSLGLLFYGMRGMALFAPVSAYLIAQCAGLAGWQNWHPNRRAWLAAGYILTFFLAFVLVGRIRALVSGQVVIDGDKRHAMTLIYAKDNPRPALAFLKKNGIHGPIWHHDTFGGCILWESYPELKPFLDGRQLYFSNFQKSMLIKAQPEVYWKRAEEDFGFRIALIDAAHLHQRDLAHYLVNAPDWEIIFVKSSLAVFVKKGAFDLPTEIALTEERLRTSRFDAQDRQAMEALLGSVQTGNLFSRWFNPVLTYIDIQEEGITLFDLGFKNAGMRRILKTIEQYPNASTAVTAHMALMKYTNETP